ncbi:uncharacterized protein LOC117123571 isoform X2 [Anneissia japonica]|nr:uncharacterized protein LOC117123571 isoform X2 [Anneissia japonica]
MRPAGWSINNWYTGKVVCNNDDLVTIKYEDGIIYTALPTIEEVSEDDVDRLKEDDKDGSADHDDGFVFEKKYIVHTDSKDNRRADGNYDDNIQHQDNITTDIEGEPQGSEYVFPESEDISGDITLHKHPHLFPKDSLGENSFHQEEGGLNSKPVEGITVMQKNNTKYARCWDQIHYCMFCNKLRTKLPRHLAVSHKDEEAVAEWLKERRKTKKFTKLKIMRNIGNHLHNSHVQRSGEGALLVVNRPDSKANPLDYVPCARCYGYFTKKEIGKHRCAVEKTEVSSINNFINTEKEDVITVLPMFGKDYEDKANSQKEDENDANVESDVDDHGVSKEEYKVATDNDNDDAGATSDENTQHQDKDPITTDNNCAENRSTYCEHVVSEGQKSTSNISTQTYPHQFPKESTAECSFHQEQGVRSKPVEGITVMKTNNSKSGRRFDKVYYCMFCKIPQKKLTRHFIHRHKDEEAVSDWLTEKNKQIRLSKLTKMRNLGNHLHNSEVIRNGKGALLVVHRPTGEANALDYVPCKSCYGYLGKRDIWKHRCPVLQVDTKQTRNKRVREGMMLLSSPNEMRCSLTKVLEGMNFDEVRKVIRGDDLLLQLGDKLCSNHRPEQDNFETTRNKLREVGRLVIAFRKVSKAGSASLSTLIDPENFTDVVTAAKSIAGYAEDTQIYSRPSLALKLGGTLKMCCLIQKGNAIINGDKYLEEKCQESQELYTHRWAEEVSNQALYTLHKRRRNNPKMRLISELEVDGLQNTDEPQKIDAGKRRKKQRLNMSKTKTKIVIKRKWSNAERVAVMKHLKKNILMGRIPGKAEIEKCQKKEKCLQTRSWRNIKDYCRNKITISTACKVCKEANVDKGKESNPAYVNQEKNAREEHYDNCKEQDKSDAAVTMQEVEESSEESQAMKLLNRIAEPEQPSDVMKSHNQNSDSQSTVSEVFPYLPVTTSNNNCPPEAMEELIKVEKPEQPSNVIRSVNCNSDSKSVVSEVFPPLPITSSNNDCPSEAMELLINIEKPEQPPSDVMRSVNCNSDSESVVSEVFPNLSMTLSNNDCPLEAIEVLNNIEEPEQLNEVRRSDNCNSNSESVVSEIFPHLPMTSSKNDCPPEAMKVLNDIEEPKQLNDVIRSDNCNSDSESVVSEIFPHLPMTSSNNDCPPEAMKVLNNIEEPKQLNDVMRSDNCNSDSESVVSEVFPHLPMTSSKNDCPPEAMKVLNDIEETKQLNDVMRSDNCNSDSESVVSEVFPHLLMTSSNNDCPPEAMKVLDNIEEPEQLNGVRSGNCNSIVGEDILSTKKTSSKRPFRYCVFCNKYQSKLSRHISVSHQSIERVRLALQLPKEDRIAVFELFKREGILKVNSMQATLGAPRHERERTPKCKKSLESVKCPGCLAVLSKQCFKRHIRNWCSSKIQRYKKALSLHKTLLSYKDEHEQRGDVMKSKSAVSEVFPHLPMTSSNNEFPPEAIHLLNNIEEPEQLNGIRSGSCNSIVGEGIHSTKKTSKKPLRYCVFCNKYQSKLSRHISVSHQSIERVRLALQLPKEDRIAVFELFKREGILKVNSMRAILGAPRCERERTPKCKKSLESVKCPGCQAVLSKRTFNRHMRDRCSSKVQGYKNALSFQSTLLSYKDEYGQEFVDNILSRFNADNRTDRLCVIDPMLVEIGRRLWGKQKRNNDNELNACESVIADMRQLASLYIFFKDSEKSLGELTVMKGNISDMLRSGNFQHLENAVRNYARNNTKSQSAGLKQVLYDLLKFASKIVKAIYLLEDEDSLAAEVDKFVADLEINKDIVFGYALANKQTKDVLRIPKSSSLGQHTDVKTCTVNKETEVVIEIPSSSGRKYSKWNKCEEDVVLKYFSAYLTGEADKKIPGMKDIEQFLESQPHFRHDVRTVHTKVMNAVYKQERMIKAGISKK